MNKTIEQWLSEYGETHKNPTNKLIHWICVPTITFTLLGLLSLVKFDFSINDGIYNINLASILIIASIIFYYKLSKTIAIGMLFITGICISYIQNAETLYPSNELFIFYIVIFVLAWIGQFIGHIIEGKKPSFFKDIQFLLIGPIWLLSFIYKKLNIKV